MSGEDPQGVHSKRLAADGIHFDDGEVVAVDTVDVVRVARQGNEAETVAENVVSIVDTRFSQDSE